MRPQGGFSDSWRCLRLKVTFLNFGRAEGPIGVIFV